ncbi:hypothetical protein [Paraliomyxa miuraensis]|uniref:hypothetical protein n=1 Tax=Paraliomyxa miuraensis TaxID=376150 RepID=UPI002257F03A|nr:hypothetical protein [Paraliomyxa miuraensis]MCX4247452.1 hypothetical protein [Paraliomyxa miuraensis]
MVSDGTYGDVIDVEKVDASGAEATASQIHQAAGQLWSNLIDDMFKATWDRQYLARKLWGVADATSRDALASGTGLSVGDLAWVDSLQRLYRAVTVSATSSTWLPVSGQSGRSVLFDHDFTTFASTNLKTSGDGEQSISDGPSTLDLYLFNTANASSFAVGANGIEIVPQLTANTLDGPGLVIPFPSLLGEDWLGRPMTIEADVEVVLEEADTRDARLGIGTPHSSGAVEGSLFSGVSPQGATGGLLYEVAGRSGSFTAAKAGPGDRIPLRRGLRLDVPTGAGGVTVWDAATFPALASSWELVGRVGFPIASSDPRDIAVAPSGAALGEPTFGAFCQISATGAAVVGTNAIRIRRLRVTA